MDVSSRSTGLPEPRPLRGASDDADSGKQLGVNKTQSEIPSDAISRPKDDTGSTSADDLAAEEGKLTEAHGDKTGKPRVSAENINLSRKLKRALNILEEEIEGFVDAQNAKYPPNVERQIEFIRQVGKTINPEDGKEPGDDDEWVYEVEKLTMDDWRKEWVEKGDPKPCIQAYYHSIPVAVDASEGLGDRATSSERPQRVVINSTILRSELENIFEVKFAHYRVIMAPPFKFLVRYYTQIGERVAQLKEKLHNMGILEQDAKSAESGTGIIEKNAVLHGPDIGGSTPTPHMEKKDNAAKRQKELKLRFSHLRLLHDFVKSDLAYYLHLLAKVENTSLEAITFEDIWYLFRPGDILIAREDNHDQLYMVYAVTGSQPRRQSYTSDEIKNISADIRSRNDRPRFRIPRWNDSDDDFSDDEPNKQTLVEVSGIGTWTPLTIDCFFMGFDGLDVGPVDSCKRIKHYVGQCRITDLPVYPLRFHKQSIEVLARLEKRGRRFITSYGHKSYRGLTIPVSSRRYQENLQGEIFVDFQNYYGKYSRRKPKLGMLRKSSPDLTEVGEVVSGNEGRRVFVDHEADEKITDNFMASHHAFIETVNSEFVQNSLDYLHLFPYRVPAYVFRSRSYVQVGINAVAEIDKTDKARDRGFEDLVIPDSHRNLLVALVQNHETGSTVNFSSEGPMTLSSQIEIVRGKGRGLIILLHGPPGSGKTSTAETIAAYTRRPLYSITCGDLGITPTEVERRLNEHTDRAHRWGCVLLLDEADVYLTRRDWRDTMRNALVSVFLRQLEYYSGILFLTTNRVGVIDEAFKSRIHVSLSYPSIGRWETLEIWKKTLARIERENKTSETPIRFDKGALLSFAEQHYKKHEPDGTTWNGRQIRNAFQTAIALGRYERQRALDNAELTGKKQSTSVKLTVAHFREIAKTAREFEDYMTSVRGPDTDIAKENQLRDDRHTYDEPPRRKDYSRARGKRESSGYLTPSPVRGLPNRGHRDASRSRKTAPDVDDQSEHEDIFEENLSD